MKIIRQVGIIFFVCWASQALEALLPFDFPASVIGMLLLLALLFSGALKVDHIREKSDFLLSNMSFFFIPAGVSIINYLDVLKSCALQLAAICLVSTVITFGATACGMKAALYLMRKAKRDKTGSKGGTE